MSSPDYANMNKEEVLADFMLRIEHYQEKYQPLDENQESDLSFMKIYNTGEKVLVHKHEGHIQSRIVYYLMNIHIVPRTIYLTRHGESVMNLEGKIGGDSELSERGWEYAKALATYITNQDIQVRRVVRKDWKHSFSWNEKNETVLFTTGFESVDQLAEEDHTDGERRKRTSGKVESAK